MRGAHIFLYFFFSSRRRHTRYWRDWSSDVCSSDLEIKNREQAIAGLKARLGEYQGRLSQEPIREQQLADLTRGYEQSKSNYDDLLKKKNESAMATSMELLQQG